MRKGRSPVDEQDLQAMVDGRLSPDRAALVEAYLAEHPQACERLAQYIEQRQALRYAVGALDAPVPARLRVGRIIEQRRQRRRAGLRILARLMSRVAGLICRRAPGPGGRSRAAE